MNIQVFYLFFRFQEVKDLFKNLQRLETFVPFCHNFLSNLSTLVIRFRDSVCQDHTAELVKCPVCSRQFKNSQCLGQHVRQVHETMEECLGVKSLVLSKVGEWGADVTAISTENVDSQREMEI